MQTYCSRLIIPFFLERFSILLNNLKSAFESLGNGISNSTSILHVNQMKRFVLESGGLRCVEMLAEYEKYCSIRDRVSCKALCPPIIKELSIFRENWINMLG